MSTNGQDSVSQKYSKTFDEQSKLKMTVLSQNNDITLASPNPNRAKTWSRKKNHFQKNDFFHENGFQNHSIMGYLLRKSDFVFNKIQN